MTIGIAGAVLIVLVAWAGDAQAQTTSFWWWRPRPRPVPEIDPAAMRTTVTLLVGGVLAFADRFRRR